MPNFSEIFLEISNYKSKDKNNSSIDTIRRKYIKRLGEYRNRNIICYYSWFLQKDSANLSINDDDKNGFMNAIYKMDKSKWLDLLLHTPWWNIAATESIIDYLHQIFWNNIVSVIPQLSMSWWTLIACWTKEIIMWKQSNLWPVDPQFWQIPVHWVIDEYNKAKEEIKIDKNSIPLWQTIFNKYHPTFIWECLNAIDWWKNITKKSLERSMYKGKDKESKEKIKKIVKYLNTHNDTLNHSRHLWIDKCKEVWLKIIDLEDDNKLQDLVLSVHHCYMNTFGMTNASKIIENNIWASYIKMKIG